MSGSQLAANVPPAIAVLSQAELSQLIATTVAQTLDQLDRRAAPAQLQRSHLTPREACEALSISRRTLARMLATGRLRAAKLDPSRGGRVLIERASIDELLREAAR